MCRELNLNDHKLDNDVRCQRKEIIQMLRQYGRGHNEFIMMVHDINQQENDERLILEMDSEHKTALRDLL